MIIHYIKIAFRNLASQKRLAFINVAGLSIGLACFSLFLLYAVNEFSFDSFHKNEANIYRVYEWTEGFAGRESGGDASMYMPLGPAMKQDFPEVENYVRFYKTYDEKFITAGDNTTRYKLAFTDPQIFSVFSFKLLYGNATSALQGQHNVVLTKDKALQIFGEENVVGKTLQIKMGNDFEPFTVGAVADNVPANSTIQYDVLLSWDYLQSTDAGKGAVNNWRYSGFQTYVQLRNGSSLANAGTQLATFRQKYFPAEAAELKQSGWDGKGALPISFRLQPIEDIHTNLKIGAGGDKGIDSKTTWILLGIATGVLLIACINFTTLAIGRSAKRAKEVGVRKVIGSGKNQLIAQFFTESLMLSIFSAVLGLLIAQLLLPYFNRLAERNLHFSFTQYPVLIWLFAGIALLAGIFAGSYPALVLSSFRPIEVLKSKIKLGGANFFTRSLVTIQFVLSIGLIISTVIILQQLKYMRTKDPGFNKENIVVVDADGTDAKKIYPLFKNALAAYPQVAGVASASAGFGEGYNASGFKYNDKEVHASKCLVDADFINVMGMQLVAGRQLDENHVADTVNNVIVNEAMVKGLGLTNEKVLGLRMEGFTDPAPVVVGVVKDFNFMPLNQQIEPIVFIHNARYRPGKFFVRLKPGYPAQALAQLQKAWSGIVQGIPLQYSFLDDKLDSLYRSEERWGNVVGWAGVVSIFLACLGLFGLAGLAAINRTKEIGVRKVLGASVPVIVTLLAKEFLQLVAIAMLVTTPLTWYLMHNWLQDYAYRINISAWLFVIIGVAALVIALLTVTAQALKTALMNPVKSLKVE